MFAACALEGYGVGGNSHPSVVLQFRMVAAFIENFDVDYAPREFAPRYCSEPLRPAAPVNAVFVV